jgi:N-acetylmuramoyl-L-alanine amidase CwlA
MQIKKQIVSQNVINQRSYGLGNPKKYITIHQTGNPNKGADAQAHANIQSRLNPRQASWHYQADDKVVIQSFEDNVKCWHSGDGRGPGNTESIGIEICINEDGDYKKAIENAAELVKHLMNKHNIPIENVKQHYDWSRKNCPAQLRANHKGISWNDFLNLVKKEDKKEDNKDIYIVQTGDTLYKIAAQHDTTTKALIELNDIVTPDLIYKGQKIKLPTQKEVKSKQKYVRVKASQLWVYDKPDWNAKHSTVKQNEVFTIKRTLKVNGHTMHQLKSGLYITNNSKYVEVYEK